MSDHIISALPLYYLAKAEDGGLWIVRDGSKGETTGPQKYLAHIPATVLGVISKTKDPQTLIIAEMA